jgi:hypothetical protein
LRRAANAALDVAATTLGADIDGVGKLTVILLSVE